MSDTISKRETREKLQTLINNFNDLMPVMPIDTMYNEYIDCVGWTAGGLGQIRKSNAVKEALRILVEAYSDE